MLIESESIETNPLVSVIILVYNHKKYIKKCLDSILSQKVDFPYEIIVGDDYSTDGSREICLSYKNRYPEIIRLLFHEKNGGLIFNYSQLKKSCRGKYIAQIAGDDYWCNDEKLQIQVSFLESHLNVGLCYTNTISCDDEGIENTAPMIDSNYMPKSFEEQLFKTCYMAPNTWMMRSSVDKSISEQQAWFTDESLAVALDYLHESKMAFLDCVTSVYRVHEGSLAAQKDIRKKWEYSKGLFKMQMYYAQKYNVGSDVLRRLLFQEYASKMLMAIEANDEAFVKNALEYYSSQGMEMKWFALSCREYVNDKQKYKQISKSHAYRLGKLILKPLRLFKK